MARIPEDIKKLNEKIEAVKKENNAKNESSLKKQGDYSNLGIALQAGIELVSGTVVGASIGYILDEVFDFKFIFLLIFTIFGSIAGLVNVARYLKKIDEQNEKGK
ncbi:MAG: AtpZ/AtpI family protein [Alphaproteobacteria bacterium]|nr:AtpZ/AtpI family protein [Alphaproteobacteria bacterium]